MSAQKERARTPVTGRLISCVRSALPGAVRTSRWFISIMIPISLAVTLLSWSGVLGWLASWLDPAFVLLGLPGKSALVFITGICLNIYSAIAVITTLGFTTREVTILALMSLISHNLFVETAVQKRTGSGAARIVFLRLSMSIVGAVVLNFFLPRGDALVLASAAPAVPADLPALLAGWMVGTLRLVLKIVFLITSLMILQNALKEFGIITPLSRLLAPALRLLGLPYGTSFLWIVAQTLGLAFGAGIMIAEKESGRLSPTEADLLNHHVAINHSLLEDTLLFMAIGVPVFWITVPRLLLASAAVWYRRAELGFRTMKSRA